MVLAGFNHILGIYMTKELDYMNAYWEGLEWWIYSLG